MGRKWIVSDIRALLAAVLLFTGTAAVIAAIVTDFDGIGDDLSLNLVAETLVIVWAYFTIDRLIEQRRKRQLEPARCLLYARLLEMVDQFLGTILPEEFREESIKKHKYGEIYAISTIDLPDQEIISSLPKLIKRDIENRGPFYDKPLSQFREQLNDTLDRSLTLLDPEPMNLLLRLSFVYLSSIPTNGARATHRHTPEDEIKTRPVNRFLTRFRRLLGQESVEPVPERRTGMMFSQDFFEPVEEGPQRGLVLWLTGVITATIEVRMWLECMLDQYFFPQT